MATVAPPAQPAAGATAAPTVEDLVPGKVASRKKSDALAVKVPGRARPPREASPASVNGFPALEDDATDGASVEQEVRPPPTRPLAVSPGPETRPRNPNLRARES